MIGFNPDLSVTRDTKFNMPVKDLYTIMDNVMYSADEAKIEGIFLNTKATISMHTTPIKMYQTQPQIIGMPRTSLDQVYQQNHQEKSLQGPQGVLVLDSG